MHNQICIVNRIA